MEEITRIDEMPYAGNKAPVHGDVPEKMTKRSGLAGVFLDKPNPKGVAKYMGSTAWSKLASRVYVKFPYPVWVVPFAGSDADPKLSHVFHETDGERTKLLPLLTGFEILQRMGVDTSNISNDSLVILATASAIEQGFMPTPWMVFHAALDANRKGVFGFNIGDVFYEIVWGETMDGVVPPVIWNSFVSGPEWNPSPEGYPRTILTMKSGRDKRINSCSDIAPEMVCQELLTPGGLTFSNTDGFNDEQKNYLRDVAHRVKQCAQAVIESCKGKMMVTSVA